jgi:hypothetical protein
MNNSNAHTFLIVSLSPSPLIVLKAFIFIHDVVLEFIAHILRIEFIVIRQVLVLAQTIRNNKV